MERIDVTRTFLPPIEEYERYLKQIWGSGQLTNNGPLLKELQSELQSYLGVPNLHLVSNGTLALQLALRALDITEGEVITTPFSYVATTSAIMWERCKPVFVDIEPETFCIDVSKIEAAITKDTKAIMPVHVFGHPCNVEEIQAIAKKHGLKVIYDAAHAMGVEYKGKSLLDYGDISVCSFHATKLFHAIEGGCLITKDKGLSDKIELLKRFGHDLDEHYMLGINAKASEFQAAMGLCNLKYIDENIRKRRELHELYNKLLGDAFSRPKLREDTAHNYGYFPILLKDEKHLLRVREKLAEYNIHPRRYFFPSLNTLPYVVDSQSCPVSEDISRRILCLPLFADLEPKYVHKICEVSHEEL